MKQDYPQIHSRTLKIVPDMKDPSLRASSRHGVKGVFTTLIRRGDAPSGAEAFIVTNELKIP